MRRVLAAIGILALAGPMARAGEPATILLPQAEEIQLALEAGHFAFGCTPYLPDAPGQSTDWSDQLARGNSLPTTGEILLDCTMSRRPRAAQWMRQPAAAGVSRRNPVLLSAP
jgi:hypothetical protein